MSKTGLNALMEVLAIELAPVGVRVNMLTPGSFLTGLTHDMTDSNRLALEVEIPLSRSAEPDELAATALLLLSDRLSPYTTGTNFVVDRGDPSAADPALTVRNETRVAQTSVPD